MQEYKLSLKREILAEQAGGVFADYNKYIINHPEVDVEEHPITIMSKQVWLVKESILGLKTMSEIDVVKGKIKMAKAFLIEWEKYHG